MTIENYYLACYQSILDRNLIKFVKLFKLTKQEILNYPKEYPHLDANEIFKANYPEDFIDYLLGTADFYLSFFDAMNLSSTPENIAIREKSFQELTNHPLIDYCPIDKSSIINNLLAVSYSNIITKEEVTAKLTTIINYQLLMIFYL